MEANLICLIFCFSTVDGRNGYVPDLCLYFFLSLRTHFFCKFPLRSLIHFNFFFADLEGGRYFFNAVKEGDSILWACDDENECHLWVMALYRATGQAHKPTPLTSNTPKTAGLCKTQAGYYFDILV